MSSILRREFLEKSTRGALGVAAGAATFPRATRAGAVSPNERVVMGFMALGGRGCTLLRGFSARDDVEVAYICDVDDGRGAGVAGELKERKGKEPRRVRDFRRILDDKAVDALVIATPDHWHAPATVRACQAGKHVYVEKSPTHCIWEGRKMVEAARKYKRVVQVGTQNRSAPYNLKAIEYIRSGKMGTIHLCRVHNLKSGGPHRRPPDSDPPPGVDYDRWLGPAPKRPFNRAHFHGGWLQYFAYCSGDTGNDGIHQIDLARWLIGQETPKAVSTSGGRLAFPDDDAEVPDTQVAVFEFDGLLMTFELTQYCQAMYKTVMQTRQSDSFPNWLQNATRIELYGTKNVMIMGRHGGGWQAFAGDGEVIAQMAGRFPDDVHQQDFIDAVRGGKSPSADIEEGHRSTILVHLANIAMRTGRRLTFDGKTETFPGDPEANAFLKKDYREPYGVPDVV